MLFGKEFAEISFPWLIMLLDESMLLEKDILMIPLHSSEEEDLLKTFLSLSYPFLRGGFVP